MIPTQKAIWRHYLQIYLLVLVTVGSGTTFLLWKHYAEFESDIKDGLVQNAHVTHYIMDAQIGDAAKLLDVAKPKFIKLIDSGALTPESAHQILAKNKEAFSSYVSNAAFYLSTYLDENGAVWASNKGLIKPSIDASDRLYFQTLKNNPKLPFAIGNLVTARITGISTIHIAVPLVDRAGKFRGVIAQQVIAKSLTEILAGSLDGDIPGEIVVHLTGGNIAFSYPKISTQNEAEVLRNAYVNKKINASVQQADLIEVLAPPEFPKSTYIGIATSQAYGFNVSASLPKAQMMLLYFHHHLGLIIYSFLTFFVLSFGIWVFYRNALNINSTLIMSLSDSLTKLKNRRAFDSEFPLLWKDAMRTKQPISALFIDIDHFKSFNDEYGHDCGDVALIAVARTISECVQRPLDLCCRWGGEEFAVVLPDTDERGAILLANQILVAMRSVTLDFPCERNPNITVSIGIASIIVTDSNKTDDLVDMADKAMYIAKQSGRDRFAVFDQPVS